MKIDFNSQGMVIKFDKVPKFLYFNEENRGIGKVFLNGVQRKGLVDVRIHAHTRESIEWPDLEYCIKYNDMSLGENTQYIGNLKEGIHLDVRIKDMPMFDRILSVIKGIKKDENIPENTRQQYIKKFVSAINPDYIIVDGKDEIVDFYMKEE